MAAAFAWPVAWLVYVFGQGTATNRYPYPFLNAAELGMAAALRNTAAAVALALVFALVFKLLDAKLPGPGGTGGA